MNGLNEQVRALVMDRLERTAVQCDGDLKMTPVVQEIHTNKQYARITISYVGQDLPAEGVQLDLSGTESLAEIVEERFEFSPVKIKGTVEEVNRWTRELEA